MACAVHPDYEYSAVSCITQDGRQVTSILAKALVENVMDAIKGSDVRELGSAKGSALEGLSYRHPFIDRTCPVVLARYVTLTDGTGVVHTAPGHGQEDYLTGAKYKIEVVSPVDEDGVFTDEAGRFAGMDIYKGNGNICKHLKEQGYLLAESQMTHSYPHCWRCKKPVIFRATDQWFLNVEHDDLRHRCLEAIRKVKWIPGWGQIRISSMVEQRPDWCLSRQRTWGVPIPAFYCNGCNEVLLE